MREQQPGEGASREWEEEGLYGWEEEVQLWERHLRILTLGGTP